jgi:hypothetical protein
MEKLITPIGKIKFPTTTIGEKVTSNIYVPDGYIENKSRKDSWSFVLTLDPKEPKVKELLKMLDEEHAKIKKANFKPYKMDKSKNEKDEIVETGLIAINFKSSYPPFIMDSKRNTCKEPVTWGSRVCVAFAIKPVEAQGKIGLGRYCKAIQVIELAESKTDYGFAEEEGFTTAKVASSAPEKKSVPEDIFNWDDKQ